MPRTIPYLIAISALAIFLSISGCDRSADISANTPAKEPPAAIHYVRVLRQAIPETLDLAAKVQPDPTKVVRIFPPASGRVVSIEVKPGDPVRRGQTIAILSSSDVASAQSDFTKANIEAERTTRAMKRQKVLFEHGAAAEKDYIDEQDIEDGARA